MALDMTRGKPLRLIVRFALPLMLSSMLQQLYTMCDSVIVGRLIGTEAFAAIGSSSFLQWFLTSMLIGLSQGFGVVFAQRYGAKDHAGFRRAFAMGLTVVLIVAAILTGAGLALLQPFLRLLRTPGELWPYMAAYLRVMWMGLALTGLYNVCASALRALGDSRSPFIALVIATALNIALDILFLAAFGMGVEGAALATLIAQACALGYCLLSLRHLSFAMPRREDWRPERATLRELLRLGVPPMLSFSVISTGELAMQRAVNSYGVIFVTGMTASQRYFSLLNIIGSALEGAVATFVGQNAGAKQTERIVSGTRTAVWLGVVSSMITSALVMLFRKDLILLFVPASNAQAVQIGMDALFVEATFLVSLYMLCLHRAALQGMGNALIPMLSGFMELALRLLWVLWAAPNLVGREGLYFTDSVTWIGTAILLMTAYYVTRRRMIARLERAEA